MNTDITVDKDQLRKLVLFVENDLDALGWDRPPRLYVVVGKPEDPRLELMFELPDGHPFDILTEMQTMGMRLKDQVMGLALATEGWRHLHFSEVAEQHPGMVDIMRSAAKLVYPEADDKEIDNHLNKIYTKQITPIKPSTLPEDKRVELRTVQVVFRNQSSALVMRDRGAEPEAFGLDDNSLSSGGRIASILYALLTGTPYQDNSDAVMESFLKDED